MSLENNIKELKQHIPEHVNLIAVSKTKSTDDILEVYRTGQRVFGENKVQELVTKHETLPKDIDWHMIGHLQTNKIKYIAPFISLIHSVDSLKLLKNIDKEALRNNRIIDCLLQFHIATESTKFGLDLEEANQLLASEAYKNLNNVRIIGLMGMSTFTDNMDQVRQEFKFLKKCFLEIKNKYFYNRNEFCEISMGMTNDYQVAIEEGSTMVRIGTLIFGERTYH